MDQKLYQEAAKELLKRRESNLKHPRLSENLRPNNVSESLAIQKEVINQSKEKLIGWKCLLPVSDEKLFVGAILSNTQQKNTICYLKSDNTKARIEPEIAFVLGTDLPARSNDYSEEEINIAINKAHIALELIQARFDENTKPSFHEKLADSLNNQGLYLGPEIDKDEAFSASNIKISIEQNNNKTNYNGKHLNEFPQKPLYWLINFMSKKGITFKKGQAIITGSYSGIIDVEFNQLTTIEYKGFGKFDITFKEVEV